VSRNLGDPPGSRSRRDFGGQSRETITVEAVRKRESEGLVVVLKRLIAVERRSFSVRVLTQRYVWPD